MPNPDETFRSRWRSRWKPAPARILRDLASEVSTRRWMEIAWAAALIAFTLALHYWFYVRPRGWAKPRPAPTAFGLSPRK